jgi:tRNA U38,U39,U40 pseudouridine synthase TruA
MQVAAQSAAARPQSSETSYLGESLALVVCVKNAKIKRSVRIDMLTHVVCGTGYTLKQVRSMVQSLCRKDRTASDDALLNMLRTIVALRENVEP